MAAPQGRDDINLPAFVTNPDCTVTSRASGLAGAGTSWNTALHQSGPRSSAHQPWGPGQTSGPVRGSGSSGGVGPGLGQSDALPHAVVGIRQNWAPNAPCSPRAPAKPGLCVCVHVYMCVHTRMCVHVRVYVCIRAYMCVRGCRAHVCPHVCPHVHACSRVRACTCGGVHVVKCCREKTAQEHRVGGDLGCAGVPPGAVWGWAG